MRTLAERLAAVRGRIAAAERHYGRVPHSVSLLAVSKGHPVAAIAQVYAAGQARFGESYLQEALPKLAALAALDIEWHYTGAVQGNKTRPIAERFAWVHGVDREKSARRLSDQRPATLPPLNVCIQVNVGEEAQKAGVSLRNLPALADIIANLPHLELRGLMALPPVSDNLLTQRDYFRLLREARDELHERGLVLDTLSMGMSGDLEAAIAEGATMVRVGSALFGARPG